VGGREVPKEEHVRLAKKWPAALALWRDENPDLRLDLSGCDLSGANLSGANLFRANLTRAGLAGAKLRQVNLAHADLQKADLRGADLFRADLMQADLGDAILANANLWRAELWRARLPRASLREAKMNGAKLFAANLAGADLSGAILDGADLRRAILRGADLEGADLSGAALVFTDLRGANLTDCRVFGTSVWSPRLEGAIQRSLIVTRREQEKRGEVKVTVDELEVAQFVYLLMHNEKIQHVIDTVTSKVALILGRFKPERKAVLDALREELRKHDLVPILFDFAIPKHRDITETVTLLARMARFIVADLTEPSSIPQELQAIVPDLLVPVQPILQEGYKPWAMFGDLRRKYHWVLEIQRYTGVGDLLGSLNEKVLLPAEAKRQELGGE
jgi:uncharacterized protein YjbI with pentapeptide repeats